MRGWQYWSDPDYWRWRWRTIGSDARAPLAVLAAVAFGALGYLIASGLSAGATAETGSVYETTVMRTQVSTRDGATVVHVVPAVRTVRVASSETVLKTATRRVVRTIATPAGTNVVTDSVTTRIPVVRRVVVTTPGDMRVETRTDVETRTNVETRTSTIVRTETVTRTQTVSGAPVTVTQTHTVTQPTATETVTVTSPVQIVTVTVPVFP